MRRLQQQGSGIVEDCKESKTDLTTDDVDRAFRTSEVFNAPDDTLIKYLRVLNTGSILNETTRHRAINRCITINAVINLRLAKRIDRSNRILSFIVIVLAIANVAATILQSFR